MNPYLKNVFIKEVKSVLPFLWFPSIEIFVYPCFLRPFIRELGERESGNCHTIDEIIIRRIIIEQRN